MDWNVWSKDIEFVLRQEGCGQDGLNWVQDKSITEHIRVLVKMKLSLKPSKDKVTKYTEQKYKQTL